MPKQKRRVSSRGKTVSKTKVASRKPSVTSRNAPIATSSLVQARNSKIHGRGVYAIAPIKKGTRVLEYLGERITHQEADRRYAKKRDDDGHTFLFIASQRTVIDAGAKGNDARFINHSCNPNCETAIIEVGGRNRVFIDAIRNIKPGEELGYDYQLTWDSTDEPEELALYACRCGARQCRGTMLDREPLDKQAEKKKKKSKAKRA